MNIYSGFMYNLPKNLGWETTQMFSSRGMDKHAGTHPYNGIWHINIKKWTSDTYNNNDSQTHFAKWKKPDSKVRGRVVSFMWHSGGRDSEHRNQSLPGSREREELTTDRKREGFWGEWIFSDHGGGYDSACGNSQRMFTKEWTLLCVKPTSVNLIKQGTRKEVQHSPLQYCSFHPSDWQN